MTTAAGTRRCVSAAVIQGRLPAICRSVVTHIHQTVAMLFGVTVIARAAADATAEQLAPRPALRDNNTYRYPNGVTIAFADYIFLLLTARTGERVIIILL